MALSFKVEEMFNVELQRLFTVLNDVSSWVVFDRPRVLGTKNGQITLAFDDRTRAIISFELVDGSVNVRVVHELVPDLDGIKPRELYWREVFSGVHRRLEIA